MNIGHLLTLSANKFPDRTALLFEDKRLTYREFNQRANRFANAVLGLGLKKGEKVAVLLFNSNQFVESYFGTIKAGGVFTPINFRLAPEEALYILNHSDARVFVFGDEFAPLVAKIRPQLSKVDFFISVGKPTVPELLDYEPLLEASKDVEPHQPVSEQDECQLMYTSGTTGKPKGAVITHRNVL